MKTYKADLHVHSSFSNKPTGETAYSDGVMNFKSIGDFKLPEYPELKLSFPPLLNYFEREEFTRIHVSTPGTIGLVALFIAKLMDIPIPGQNCEVWQVDR